MPRFVDEVRQASARMRAGRLKGAERTINALLERYPDVAALHANRAILNALRGRDGQAIAALDRAVSLGLRGFERLLKTKPLNRLAGDPRAQALVAKARAAPPPEPTRPAPPRIVAKGQAFVGAANSHWDWGQARVIVRFAFPDGLKRKRLVSEKTKGPLASLAVLVRRGLAAGNAGDLYDNRDGGHSALPFDPATQLSHTRYGDAPKSAGLHYGLNQSLLFDAVTFGNSSTAIVSRTWRSLPRAAMTTAGGAARLWQHYANNHIYVFPANKDFGPAEAGGKGDLFHGNTPYLLTSEGSSGSDKPFLQAIQAILAAFPPDVKAKLKAERLIAPTVQQVFRSGLKNAPGRRGYLSPLAHPSVFEARHIDLSQMIGIANSLKADRLPPLATILMVDEPRLQSGVSFFGDGLTERLFDTPGAIARLWRGVEGQRRYVLRARARDPNGLSSTFHWRLLRGDPGKVRITPRSADGSEVEIVVDWQEARPVPGRPGVMSHRVDVAAFADNGAALSAPAFFTIQFPSHQKRVYAGSRIKSVDYAAPNPPYQDPILWPKRGWRDDYRYDADGVLQGWTRTEKGKVRRFAADGREIVKGGKATLAVRHKLVRSGSNPHAYVHTVGK